MSNVFGFALLVLILAIGVILGFFLGQGKETTPIGRSLHKIGTKTKLGRKNMRHTDIADVISLGHEQGAVEKEDRDRILGALNLSKRTVQDVMRHRRQIEMIEASSPPDTILAQMLASPHTRLPLFQGSDDKILGVVHVKELLREIYKISRTSSENATALASLDIVKVAMKPYFIPETTPLDEQIRQFLKRRTHFALVVDEYGDLQGLITLEDILEEIVGDITDEFDVVSRKSNLTPSADGSYQVDGAMTLRDLNRELDWTLPDDAANTIAGLIIHEAQIIPDPGQSFRFHNLHIEILARRDNRITRVSLRPLPKA